MSDQKPNLSRLEPVDLRTIWKSESGDFTPWLADEGNLQLLGDAIGIELEFEAREQSVGSFWADIVCRDTATDQRVLIENQLEKTDHSHLGQLMTYAAGLDANTVVWISARFTEEHRAALDWLNAISGPEFNFFGLEVELWRIGESDVAPKFNLTCKPNDWSKGMSGRIKPVEGGGLTEAKQLQLEFWTAFRERVLEEDATLKPQKPLPRHWMNMAIGRSNFHLAAIASHYDSLSESYETNELRVELVLKGNNWKAFFGQLEPQKDAIESELGQALTWHKPEDKQMGRIFTRRDADLHDRDRWQEYQDWLLENLRAFRRVFRPRVMNLTTKEEQEEIGPD